MSTKKLFRLLTSRQWRSPTNKFTFHTNGTVNVKVNENEEEMKWKIVRNTKKNNKKVINSQGFPIVSTDICSCVLSFEDRKGQNKSHKVVNVYNYKMWHAKTHYLNFSSDPLQHRTEYTIFADIEF
tara:strand:- start:17 stop:394 length:378 start_codon:yes stop_codon:yes gene_type:complete